MINFYNIEVNLKEKLYNFYEWNDNDKIIKLSIIKAFLVDDNTYDCILSMKIKVEENFLNKIKEFEYTCIFCNYVDSVCVKFNKNGTIRLISKILLEDEILIINKMSDKKVFKLKYEFTNGKNNYSYNTREEDKIIKDINKYIDNLKNEEIINYLYYEWFNIKIDDNKYEKLKKVINGKFCDKHIKIHEIIKLLV